MSQNKTRVAGLDSNNSGNYGGQNMSGTPDSSFYARTGNEPKRGTVISGLGGNESHQGGQSQSKPQSGINASERTVVMQSGKPVVGFLYSVSRTGFGEFWPLHIGQNTIGQSASCDVVLPEGTVSSEHAVLVVRKLKNPEKVIASLCDSRSTNGTMLNGVSLGFNPVDCNNGDIITVGDSYELYVVLIDTALLGLHVSDSFISVDPVAPVQDVPSFEPGNTRAEESLGGFNPPSFTPGYNGTVGMDGVGPSGHGGTVGM